MMIIISGNGSETINLIPLLSVSFIVSSLFILIFGLLIGVLLSKCCSKPNNKKQSPVPGSAIPIYEEVTVNISIDERSIKLESNEAYGTI